MSGAWSRHGEELYLRLLHANFLGESAAQRAAFSRLLLDATAGIPTSELRCWIQGGAWREMLVAGWVVGLRQEVSLRELVRDRLLASSTCFAGQGLCMAVARFADEQAAEELEAYLEKYLPAGDRRYDQEWAIGALAWLDALRPGSRRAERFLAEPLWTLEREGRQAGAMRPEDGILLVRRAMDFVDAALAPASEESGGVDAVGPR